MIKDQAVRGVEEVEQRLVEAIRVTWRQPDRERAWLTVRAYWPEAPIGEAGDYGGDGVDGVSSTGVLRTASLTRRETALAEEALAWVGAVKADDDRLLIGVVLRQLAAHGGQVAWASLRRDRPRWKSADGLRMRYRRAFGAVVKRANAGR